jgi:hypothetical protein
MARVCVFYAGVCVNIFVYASQKKWLQGPDEEDGDEGMGLNDIIETINSTFSEMFKELGVSGQVKLKEAKQNDADDFENYGLSILVMFRLAFVC